MATSDPSSPTDPPRDHPATTVPYNIPVILHVARILLGYGRNLIDTIRHRAAAPSFDAIAATFGTANLATILAEHLQRGILRAIALERFLLARAPPPRPRHRPHRARLPHATATARPSRRPGRASPRRHRPRASRHLLPTRRADGSDPGFFMPTLEDLERQACAAASSASPSPISAAISPSPSKPCTVHFWDDLLAITVRLVGGNLAALMEQNRDNAKAFDKERGPQARPQLGLVDSETRRPPQGPRLLHRRATGQPVRSRPDRHRPALTRRTTRPCPNGTGNRRHPPPRHNTPPPLAGGGRGRGSRPAGGRGPQVFANRIGRECGRPPPPPTGRCIAFITRWHYTSSR